MRRCRPAGQLRMQSSSRAGGCSSKGEATGAHAALACAGRVRDWDFGGMAPRRSDRSPARNSAQVTVISYTQQVFERHTLINSAREFQVTASCCTDSKVAAPVHPAAAELSLVRWASGPFRRYRLCRAVTRRGAHVKTAPLRGSGSRHLPASACAQA